MDWGRGSVHLTLLSWCVVSRAGSSSSPARPHTCVLLRRSWNRARRGAWHVHGTVAVDFKTMRTACTPCPLPVPGALCVGEPWPVPTEAAPFCRNSRVHSFMSLSVFGTAFPKSMTRPQWRACGLLSRVPRVPPEGLCSHEFSLSAVTEPVSGLGPCRWETVSQGSFGVHFSSSANISREISPLVVKQDMHILQSSSCSRPVWGSGSATRVSLRPLHFCPAFSFSASQAPPRPPCRAAVSQLCCDVTASPGILISPVGFHHLYFL